MAGMAVGGSGGKVAWVGATCALVGGALAYALWGAHGPLGVSDRSGLVSMAVALPALVVSVIGLLWARPGAHEDESAAVARLVREVRSVGEPQWMHSLGGELTPIDVTFAFRPYAHARAAALPPTPAGQLERVIEDYRAVRPRRLVITGEPGAGKTVLARKLVMELNKARGESEPVAVLIVLADWDTQELLADWIVRHLEWDLGMPRRSARKVMQARMVLPVLDGLDEMDAADVEVADSRARLALEALARYQDGPDPAPLVLTCRTRRYDELEAVGSHILDAARIEIDPVGSAQAVRFLELRGAARRPAQWQPVLDELRHSPTGVLASALSTPWRLALAATVYEWQGNPRELVNAATASDDAVAELLLGRFIGEVAGHAPRGAGRYPERVVHTRLSCLAVGLETDLVLQRLGDRVAGAVRAVAIGVLTVTAVVQVLVLWRWPSDVDVLMMCGSGLVANVPLLYTEIRPPHVGSAREGYLPTTSAPPLGSPVWRLGLRRFGRKRVPALGVLLLLGVSVWAALTADRLSGAALLQLALLVGWAVLAIVTLAVMVELDSADAGPGGPVRAVWCIAVLLGVQVTISVTISGGPGRLELMFAGFVPTLLVAMRRDWVGYLVHRVANPFLGPCLPTFLDWCVTAGLLRTSGIAYQFRHREFQEWLVRHPQPPP